MARLESIVTAAATLMVAAAVFTPAPARAGNVLLWACHGPGGEPLGVTPSFRPVKGGDGVAAEYDGGCARAGAGGLSATFSRSDPEGGSLASWQLAVPEGVTLETVRIARTVSGFGEAQTGDPQWYEARTSSEPIDFASLESIVPPFGGVLEQPATGRFVRLGVGCKLPAIESCATPSSGETVGVEISSIALGVLDDTPPTGGVEHVPSPAAGALTPLLHATDTGIGLASAEASLGSLSTFVRLGSGACPEHPSTGATIEFPLGADCPKEVSGIPMPIDTEALADGEHMLRVSVTDAASNTTTLLDEPVVVRNSKPPTGTSATVTLGIGSGAAGPPSAPPGSSHGAGGALGFSSATPGGRQVACQLPELSMKLTSKPLRYAKIGKRRVPVLRARRRYVFRGRLTCLLNDKRRVSAPNGIVLRVLYRLNAGHRGHRGHRTYASGRGTMTVHNGRLKAILGYYSSRTIIFRYSPGDGEFAQVELPVKIARGHTKARSGHRKAGRRR